MNGKILDDTVRHLYARVRNCLRCRDKFLAAEGKFICRDCSRHNPDVSVRESSPQRAAEGAEHLFK